MNYPSISSLWDIPQNPSQFSQLPDEDFLALLQKQFPHSDNTDPLLPRTERQSPASDDSSPSPTSNPDATSSRPHSLHLRITDNDDASLKRKASSDDLEQGPSSKNQHTGPSPVLLSLTRSL